MKEIIVFERDIEYLKELEREREEMFMTFPEYRIEQVPETFAELKELCKKLKIGDCEVYITLQLTDKMKLYFYDNGEIIGAYLDFEYEFSLAKGRTPQQMWQIIKSLIGEE